MSLQSPPPAAAPAPGRRANRAQVRRVLWITLLLNLGVAAIKLVIGFLSANLTVLADGAHSILDSGNNVLALAALKLSWRPPDANHPYGHRKFEALASLAIGALMALASWEVLRAIVGRHFGKDGDAHEHRLEPSYLIAVGVSFVVTLGVSLYERRRGRQLGSLLLAADASHTRADAVLTLLGLSSLALAPRLPWVDVALSLIVVLFILYSSWRVVRENVLLLSDAAQLDPGPIREVVEAVEHVANSHAIRTHGMPDDVHLDLHIVVDAELTAAQTQRVEMEVRQAVQNRFPQVSEVSIHHQTEQPRTGAPLIRPR
ncbi:MAG: Cadmium, cobalt and zinc/H(+)-K(+) antiporter [candidate division BRC1 bacterium ADurb.BinA292]|nr:MAG: Cadmium, cobalt and zinc/H(+)-K(+) antiporter [candidate division BRC1 bacterium ADurb.BinA292]